MKRFLSAIILLLSAGPMLAQEQGGVRSELGLSSGLRFHSNPGFDQQGDRDVQLVSQLRFGVSSETRRAKLAFAVEGEFKETRLSRGEAKLTYHLRSATSELKLQSFARREDSGGLNFSTDAFGGHRLVDLSAPGGRVRTAGLAAALEMGLNWRAGVNLAFGGVTQRRELPAGGLVARSRRFDVKAGIVLRHDLNAEHFVATMIGIRRISSEMGGVTTARNGAEWSLAFTRENDWGDLTAELSQRQHLAGPTRLLKLSVSRNFPTGDIEAWVGRAETPNGGHPVVFGVQAQVAGADRKLTLDLSREYSNGLDTGLDRVAEYGKLEYAQDLTSRAQLSLKAELAHVGATAVSPSRTLSRLEASFLSKLTSEFGLRTGVVLRQRAASGVARERDRAVFLTLEHFRTGKH